MRVNATASAIAILTIVCSNLAAAQGDTLRHDSAAAATAVRAYPAR
jgi:hypothetical protein